MTEIRPHDTPAGEPGHGTPGAAVGHAEAEEIHLPPNSWVPINVALALAVGFVGVLMPRPANLIVALIGALWLVGALVGWARGARTEYLDLH